MAEWHLNLATTHAIFSINEIKVPISPRTKYLTYKQYNTKQSINKERKI